MKKRIKMFVFPVLLLGLTVWLTVQSVGRIIATGAILPENADRLPVIVIDPGHGGFDGGAVGIGDVVEKDINLAISRELYALFSAHGFEVVMTRQEDKSLENEGTSIRKRKNSDLHNRMELAESFESAILLSIHQNKFPQASSSGAQVFYGPKNAASKQLGEIMQKELVNMLDPENKRLAKPCTSSVYLIYNTSVPALLIECGFLSNQRDIGRLTDAQYQRKLAFTIFAATCESLGLQTPSES